MTASQLILLGLVVMAAVVAGYFIGRWAADREYGERAARPTPLPAPGDDPSAFPTETSETAPQSRQRRGAPPPASAGGDPDSAAAPAPRQRTSAAPPAASAGEGEAGSSDQSAAPRRARRGPPPPASAGLLGGDGRKT